MRKIIGLLTTLLAAAAAMLGCAPASRACEGTLEVQDRQLLAAIQSTLSEHSITKISDEKASTERKYIEDALRRTFEKDVVARAANSSCAVFASGENRFSIHVLHYADQPAADAAAIIAGKRKANTLKIKALTYYSLLPAGTTLVVFVADRQSYAANRQVFDAIKARYGTSERNRGAGLGRGSGITPEVSSN